MNEIDDQAAPERDADRDGRPDDTTHDQLLGVRPVEPGVRRVLVVEHLPRRRRGR